MGVILVPYHVFFWMAGMTRLPWQATQKILMGRKEFQPQAAPRWPFHPPGVEATPFTDLWKMTTPERYVTKRKQTLERWLEHKAGIFISFQAGLAPPSVVSEQMKKLCLLFFRPDIPPPPRLFSLLEKKKSSGDNSSLMEHLQGCMFLLALWSISSVHHIHNYCLVLSLK